MGILNNKKGLSLIELVVVLSIVGILTLVGIPQYGVFMAKSKVKKASTDLLQNIKLARTMAIKENEIYLITFEVDTTVPENPQYIYRIGTDADGNNGLLTDGGDNYGGHPVISYNLQSQYGSDVVFGINNLSVTPDEGPNSIPLSDAGTFTFNPNGSTTSANPSGTVYFQHTGATRGFALCVELANLAGALNLYLWQGDADHPDVLDWTEIR